MNVPRRLLVFVAAVALVALATSARAAKSTIGILVFDGFLTSDVTAPVEVFGAATKKAWFSSYEVVLVSATRDKTLRSEEGLRIVADKTIYDDLTLDVLIVPSSYTMEPLLASKDLVDFVRKQRRSAAWMASNCSGARLLAEAGVLDGKRATTWAGGEKALAGSYPKVKVELDRNVVIDEGVITSNGGAVSYQAALELLAKLSSEKLAREVADSIQLPRLRNASP